MALKTLPNDIDFATMMENNYFYADKTRYVYQLLQNDNRACFLSRPRRFGKTLLLGVLEELFNGRRDLFQDLWIGTSSDYAFPRHPVISMSLSLGPCGPEELKRKITRKLAKIAARNRLRVSGTEPGEYLGKLVAALHRSGGAKVAVLVDECDAPVTRLMDDLGVAKANAEVLRGFFAELSRSVAAAHLRFAMVAGITRYAMATLDPGPGRLEDISLNPLYAGICGFTISEFDALFSGRMGALLAALKKSGQMPPSSDSKKLRSAILDWYDGYSWGGGERILNPFAILRCFEERVLRGHWSGSGRPGHLPGLIIDDPEAFARPELESLLGDELRRADLDGLGAVPVLFHSGYLTLDKAGFTSERVETTGEILIKDIYSFRYPNFEVSSFFKNYYLKTIFENADESEFHADSRKLARALSTRDAESVGAIISKYFGAIPLRRLPAWERGFHAHVLALLAGLDFKPAAWTPDADGIPALSVELPKGVHVVIGLKFCPSADKLGGAERNEVLAGLAVDALTLEERYRCLAELARVKLNRGELLKITKQYPPGAERDEHLATAAAERLPKDVIDRVLATTVEKKLPPDDVNAALKKAAPDAYLTGEQIENKLSEAAKTALNAITEKNYHGMVACKAKEIIDLGLSTFGHEPKVKALFAPNPP